MTSGRPSMARRMLLTLLVTSGLATLVGSTVGSLNASVRNGSDSFQSGTIVLKDTVGATVCLSTGAGVDTTGNSSTCAADLLGAAVTQKPGGAVVSQTVTVANDGTINAGTAVLWSAACSSGNAGGESYHGGGNICAVTDLTVYDQTHSTCLYPQTSGACSITTGKTLADWVSLHGSQGTGAAFAAPAAGASVVFVFKTQLESTAPATVEGMAASIDFDWYLAQ